MASETDRSDGAALRSLLIEVSAKIEIGPDSISVSISRAALAHRLRLLLKGDGPDQPLTRTRLLTIRKRGVETKLVLGDILTAEPDPTLVQLIADARRWMQRLLHGEVTSVRSLARDLGRDHRHVARTLPLAFLAPDIVEAILDGRQPANLTVSSLKRMDALPAGWNDQRQALGFARPA